MSVVPWRSDVWVVVRSIYVASCGNFIWLLLPARTERHVRAGVALLYACPAAQQVGVQFAGLADDHRWTAEMPARMVGRA
jgi:hypothetical protein